MSYRFLRARLLFLRRVFVVRRLPPDLEDLDLGDIGLFIPNNSDNIYMACFFFSRGVELCLIYDSNSFAFGWRCCTPANFFSCEFGEFGEYWCNVVNIFSTLSSNSFIDYILSLQKNTCTNLLGQPLLHKFAVLHATSIKPATWPPPSARSSGHHYLGACVCACVRACVRLARFAT